MINNPDTGVRDFVGAMASADIGLVCTNGQILKTTGGGTWACESGGVGSVGFTVDGGGAAITAGKVKGFYTCPYAGTISAWSISADAGTATVQTWKIAAGTAKPTVANTISTAGVQLSAGTSIRSTTLTDFTSTAVTAGDIIAFNIGAVATATELSFQLEITKS